MSYESDVVAVAPSFSRLFRPEFEIRLDQKRAYATAAWKVAAAEITPAMNAIGGTVEAVGVPGTTATINRVVPLHCPEYPKMIAERAVARACGHNYDKTGKGYYTWFKVTVDFATPNYDLDGADAFLTISSRPSGRTMQVDDGVIVLVGGASAADNLLFVPGYTLDFQLHKMPYFDNGFYQAVAKSVNNAPWRGCPTGTVMFNGPSATRTSTVAFTTTYDITLSFEVSAIPWNEQYDATGTLLAATIGGSPYYPALDFTELFPIANFV